MLRDITIGQYYQAESVIHRLDPRVKLLGTFAYVISVFIFRNIPGFVLMTAFIWLCITLSKVPFKYMVKGLKAIALILFLTGFVNLFLTPGAPVFEWKFIAISKQGIYNTLYMITRLIYLVVGTSLMTLTTTPTRLTDGMETGLKFLNKLKVPVHEIAMMMSIALRFIPILIEETDKIMKAQMARGADFESGNIFKRVKAMVPILIPLFISAFKRADDLAIAMDSRCYNSGRKRTRMKQMKMTWRDAVAASLMLVFCTGIFLIR